MLEQQILFPFVRQNMWHVRLNVGSAVKVSPETCIFLLLFICLQCSVFAFILLCPIIVLCYCQIYMPNIEYILLSYDIDKYIRIYDYNCEEEVKTNQISSVLAYIMLNFVPIQTYCFFFGSLHSSFKLAWKCDK